MLYDLSDGPPPMGSLLESVFLLLVKRRQETELLKINALIAAVLAPHQEKNALSDTMKDLVNSMFPFINKTEEDNVAKKALKEWAGKVAFKVRPLWRAQDDKHLVSKLRKGSEQIQKSEEKRKTKKHTKF